MKFWGVFVFASTVSHYLSLRVVIDNRFNRPVVFIHAPRADCRLILACKIDFTFQNELNHPFFLKNI